MSLIINGMNLPKHSAVNGEKDTAYKCVVLAHPDNTVELVIDTEFASPYDNGHNIQRYPIVGELPDKHGALVDIAEVKEKLLKYGFSAPDMTISEFVEDELTVLVQAEVSE